jgi:hypothetical protein
MESRERAEKRFDNRMGLGFDTGDEMGEILGILESRKDSG